MLHKGLRLAVERWISSKDAQKQLHYSWRALRSIISSFTADMNVPILPSFVHSSNPSKSTTPLERDVQCLAHDDGRESYYAAIQGSYADHWTKHNWAAVSNLRFAIVNRIESDEAEQNNLSESFFSAYDTELRVNITRTAIDVTTESPSKSFCRESHTQCSCSRRCSDQKRHKSFMILHSFLTAFLMVATTAILFFFKSWFDSFALLSHAQT